MCKLKHVSPSSDVKTFSLRLFFAAIKRVSWAGKESVWFFVICLVNFSVNVWQFGWICEVWLFNWFHLYLTKLSVFCYPRHWIRLSCSRNIFKLIVQGMYVKIIIVVRVVVVVVASYISLKLVTIRDTQGALLASSIFSARYAELCATCRRNTRVNPFSRM